MANTRVSVMRVLLAVAIFVFPSLFAAGLEYTQAEKLFSYTDYDGAVQLLLPLPQKDAPTLALIGRSYLKLGEFKKATEFLEKAVAAEPGNSNYVLWLARAYGRRAETSVPFTAPRYASKARQYFEKAVELDPSNAEALNDLFEYYLEAPGILGGGLDKASRLAERISKLDSIEGHYAQARIAEKRKEYGHAEAQLRRAADLAPKQVGRVIDLAMFLAKQGKFQESDQAFQRAEQIAPNSPKVIFAKADTYIRNGRNLDTARKLLKQYLEAKLSPDDPPRWQAEKLLKQVGS